MKSDAEKVAKALADAVDVLHPLWKLVVKEAEEAEVEAPDVKTPEPLDRVRMRSEIVAELSNIIREAGNPHQHILVLTDYEVANLREVFRAAGHGWAVDNNPLKVINNGDWVGQIAAKLVPLATDHVPNATAAQLAERANHDYWGPRA